MFKHESRNKAFKKKINDRCSRVASHNQKKEYSTGLPPTLKHNAERLSGHSMEDVTVHYNSDKPNEVDALAYSQNENIFLGPGQEDKLNHEIGHVMKYKTSPVKPTTRFNGQLGNDDPALEREADELGAKLGNPHSAAETKTNFRMPFKTQQYQSLENGVIQRWPNLFAKFRKKKHVRPNVRFETVNPRFKAQIQPKPQSKRLTPKERKRAVRRFLLDDQDNRKINEQYFRDRMEEKIFLDDIINVPEVVGYFRLYLIDQLFVENLDFIMAVRQLYSNDTNLPPPSYLIFTDQNKNGVSEQQVFDQFIGVNAPTQVNISFDIEDEIRTSLFANPRDDNEVKKAYLKAYYEIHNLLATNSVLSFKRHKIWDAVYQKFIGDKPTGVRDTTLEDSDKVMLPARNYLKEKLLEWIDEGIDVYNDSSYDDFLIILGLRNRV